MPSGECRVVSAKCRVKDGVARALGRGLCGDFWILNGINMQFSGAFPKDSTWNVSDLQAKNAVLYVDFRGFWRGFGAA